ncbi:MAG: Gfo/Idh/MocA family oxidoreductase [Acidimicrobiia bacterium]|nr:Gfo/Idh/MocA family oxidoreductase [Acidimicrobiia bacterium]MDQ3499512.1 Gfo/Idh/MocA family oxidoreductase [Actinomycetota bacterium]
MGLVVGLIGAGLFGSRFITLFGAHPDVDEIALAEPVSERRNQSARQFGIERLFDSHEELLASGVDAVAIFTQRWTHAPIAIAALSAGKHVYSAVPAATTAEELRLLTEMVVETGLTYMVGETSYYYPAAIFSRERFARGDFGRFVYGEGEYLHDMSLGFYEAYEHSGGRNWKSTASFPPMLYPTHSIAMVLSVTGARMTSVSCLGQVDSHDDGVFDQAVSVWGNAMSNQTALFRTSDGGMCRINEFRRVGYHAYPQPEVRLSLFGTRASFEQQTSAASWNTLDGEFLDVTELLRTAPGPSELDEPVSKGLVGSLSGFAPIHDVSRLPHTFSGIPNGHEGSHHFLVDDFIRAVVDGTMPPNNVWDSARYCLPGIVAHESSAQEGKVLEVPDLGAPPVEVGKQWP